VVSGDTVLSVRSTHVIGNSVLVRLLFWHKHSFVFRALQELLLQHVRALDIDFVHVRASQMKHKNLTCFAECAIRSCHMIPTVLLVVL